MTRGLTVLVVFVATSWPGSVGAQFRDEARIRRSTRSILDSSEFRHLRGRLIEVPKPSDGGEGDEGDRDGGGNGDGGAGGGAGGGGNDANDRGGDWNGWRDRGRDQGGWGRPQRRVTRGVREVEGGSGGSGSSGSFGGGAGAASGLGQFLAILAWVLVAAVCGLILYYVLRAIVDANRNRDKALTGDEAPPPLEGEVESVSAPGDLAADVYVRRARQLAAAGRLREAVAQLLLGAMSHVEQQGLIRFRRGLTFRSYLAALSGRKEPRKAFRSLVRVYEPIEYGRREATRAHFEAALACYEEGFAAG